ncbi:MAG: tRNA 4-thiouridine(8) synthase ThiI [bacterium]|nr:tRNA 4-thiouridine(8) synthase ThiI [bacterium]
MKTNSIIIRYGEIALKGKNRRTFELKLQDDIKGFLKMQNITFSEIQLKMGRLYIRGIDCVPELKKVFGIHSYSPALEIEKSMETLEKEVMQFIPMVEKAETFRVSCQRIDKRFPKKSVDIERRVGEIFYNNCSTPVNLKNADLNFQVEIGEESIYIFAEKIRGYAGMPYGTAGKLVSLISAGIDSPVATFLMMKRGVEPILLHYKVTEEDTRKVYLLKEKLEEYAGGRKIKLIVIPRDELFKGKFGQLYNDRRFHSYVCVICKYLFHKKAGETARQEKALGIITGDNLAQVASQTLKNLHAYRMMSEMPVYSPLISFEKEQTIAIARQIGTYDISIISAKGCTPPKTPKTGVAPDRFLELLTQTGLLDEDE